MSDPFTPQEDSWPLGLAPSLGNPLPQRMLALTIHRDQYGPPSRSVRLEAVPAPRLKPNEAKRVLVAILATGPNFNTNFAALGLPVPVFGKGDTASVHVPGSDALGIVVDAGPGVSTVKVGQAVILDSWTGRNIRGYETHDGFNAQFAVVDEERAVPVTGALRNHTPERLAAMLLTYGTAYRAVAERLSVRPGDTVLVMGGGKGTSFPGAQIAKSLGARVLLVGSNPELARDLIARGMADAFVDRRSIPNEAFGVIPAGMPYAEWERRTEPFRRAVLEANGGKPVDKIFEHTGGENFPLLVSALSPGGTLAFFGATGKGMKGEYKETFFHDGRRFVMDARWVWMRQKQVLFRRAKPAAIFDELGLPPGRRVLVWGADRSAREFVAAARARTAEVVVIASATREKRGIAELSRMGVPPTHILDRDGFSLPEEMPDPLTPEGRLNPEYASGFTRPAQALGKALWKVFGPRVSPDVVVDRVDQDTLHFSTFVARDFDEKDVFPCGTVVLRGKSDLSIRGSHMYGASQAAEVVRLLSSGKIAMDQEDLEITDLPGLPGLQQMMLDGTMRKPKGVALVQADRRGTDGGRLRRRLPGGGRPGGRSGGPEIRRCADGGRRRGGHAHPSGFAQRLERGTPLAVRRRRSGSGGPRHDRWSYRQGDRPHRGRALLRRRRGRQGVPRENRGRRGRPRVEEHLRLHGARTPGPPRRGAGRRLRAGGRQRTRDERALPDRDRERPPRTAGGETRDHPGIRRHAAPPPPDRPAREQRKSASTGNRWTGARRCRSGGPTNSSRLPPPLRTRSPPHATSPPATALCLAGTGTLWPAGGRKNLRASSRVRK